MSFNLADKTLAERAALGGALEIYDFIIFVFFALTLSQLFFPPEMPEWLRLLQSFGIFVTGYLARPLGGILMAHFADHLGRKRVFSRIKCRACASSSTTYSTRRAPRGKSPSTWVKTSTTPATGHAPTATCTRPSAWKKP